MGLTRNQVVIVAILLAGATLVVLNQTLLSPAYPSIMADLQVDATTVQWLTSAYSLVEAIVIPLSAFLIGRFPTRKLFIAGISVFALGSLMAAFSPFFGILLLGRIFQAASTGVVMPMVFTVILLVFPREKRGSAMGIVSLVIGFAPAVGPSLSGLLVESVGWRSLFMLVTALAVLIVIFAVVFLKSYGEFEPTSFDKPSVALCSLGLLGLLYGLATITSATNVVTPITLIIFGAVLLTFFVRRQLKLEVPLLKVDVLKSRAYAIVVVLVALLQAALVGTGVLLPIYLQNLLGVSALETGLIMLPGAVLGAIMGFLAGRLFDKLGVRRIVIPGALIAAIGGCGLVGFGLDTPVPFIIVIYTCLGVGMQALVTPLNTWGINTLDNRVIQHANALQNTLNQVGASLGTAILVSLSATSTFLFPEMPALEQAMVGDSTFFASGMTGIANAVYNQHDITVCVLDNATTAMTGSQPHPGTGVTLMGPKSEPISIEAVLRALGVKVITHANPLRLDEAREAAREAIYYDGPSAIIFESPCVKLIKPGAPVRYREEACTGCGKCVLKIGCPALSWDAKNRRPVVDASLCNGCGLCTYLCEDGALECDGNEGSAQ